MWKTRVSTVDLKDNYMTKLDHFRLNNNMQPTNHTKKPRKIIENPTA